jgi:tetratricopeptide (TPR) repeat protein
MRLIDLGWATAFTLGLTIAPLTLPTISTTQTLLPAASAQSTASQVAEVNRLVNQGIQQFEASQYQAAIQSYQQALRISRDIGDRTVEASLLLSLSYSYYLLSQYDQSIDYSQQSLSIFQALDDRIGEASALNSLGIAYDSGQSEVLSGSRLRSRPSRIVYPGVCEGSAWRLGI